MKFRILLPGILALMLSAPIVAAAQDFTDDAPLEGLPTLVSIKASGGWGIGRGRQLYGYNGSAPVWWSTGEGVKMNLALDLPIVPIEVVNPDSIDGEPSTTPVVALEMEAGTGYNLSTGGTTNDAVSNNVFITTKRTTAYIPVTLGLNARSSFGPGLPSVYVGAGGGIYLTGIYEENVSSSAEGSTSFTRRMSPPVPFVLYGALGMEIPLAYSPEDGNSFFDFFGELRLTEMSNYIYDYQVVSGNGTSTVDETTDPNLLFLHDSQRSGSNVSLSLGFKINIY